MSAPVQVLAVVSAEGREGTAGRTLRELEERGRAHQFEGRKLLFHVGEAPRELPWSDGKHGWEVVRVRRKPAGTTQDMFSVLDHVAKAAPELERLLYFEDDVQPCFHAVTRMSTLDVPDRMAFVTCCDLRGYGGKLPALLEVPSEGYDGRGHWGNQALVIPGRTLRHVVGQSLPWGLTRNLADVVLSQMACSPPMPPRFGVLAPSIVQHTGELSLATPRATLTTPGRLAPNFVGVDADAFERRHMFQVGRMVAR